MNKSQSFANNEKFAFLESIRGIAAFAVVFAHILATYYPSVAAGAQIGTAKSPILNNLFYGPPLGFMISGHFAVVVFFTLSGFVLTYKFFQSGNSNDLHRQAAKRYVRLAIPIFFTVMTSYIMLTFGMMESSKNVAEITGSPEAARAFTFTPSLLSALYDATIGVLLNSDVKYNPVLWTMPIELFGSFIVFGLAAFVFILKRKWILYVIALILLSNTYYACFILGVLIADLMSNKHLVTAIRKRVRWFHLAPIMLFVWVIACFPDPFTISSGTIYDYLTIAGMKDFYSYRLWQYLGAFLLLVVVILSPSAQRILSNKFLVFIGGLSFSVYLTHYLVLHSLGDWAFVSAFKVHGYNGSAIIAAFITVTMTILISMVWKKYIDDSSVVLSKRFAKYILK